MTCAYQTVRSCCGSRCCGRPRVRCLAMMCSVRLIRTLRGFAFTSRAARSAGAAASTAGAAGERGLGGCDSTKADRWLWVWLSRVWTGWRTALVIVKPETVIGWQREAFGCCGRGRVATYWSADAGGERMPRCFRSQPGREGSSRAHTQGGRRWSARASSGQP